MSARSYYDAHKEGRQASLRIFTMMHTGSIYQTEIFQEVPLLYPEGKCFKG